MIKAAESKTFPPRLIPSGGKTLYTFGAEPIQKDGVTHYRWNYVEIDGDVTRGKIFAARKADSDVVDSDACDVIDAEYDLITARLLDLANLSWSQVDNHIDSVFGGLTQSQKSSLKMLYKCVLALIKIGP
jgi:hypothetical protein